MSNSRSILPDFDVFTPPGVSVPPGAMTEAAAGMGVPTGGLGKSQLFALSPVLSAMRGLGDDPAVPPVADGKVTGGDFLVGLGLLALVGALGYQIGKAMTPSGSSETTWGWIGVPVTLFTGPIGLGVMGIVSNTRGR